MYQRLFWVLLLLSLLKITAVSAQWESIHQDGEIGLTAGGAHYFGDLNTVSRLDAPKFAMGAFYRKQFGNYIGVRLAAHFAQLGYSDTRNTNNAFQLARNLSFNTNLFELSLQGDFNFFKFIPGNIYHSFTPYVTFGIGLFNYDPYTFLGTRDALGNISYEKVQLRPLGTEGQGDPNYPDRSPYSTIAFCFPVGVGAKYAINDRFNVGFEIAQRFTSTDYLDDVSTTYVGSSSIWDAKAQLLQDRSANNIGLPGYQRGFSNQKDQFIFAELFFSFNLTSYRCPKAD